tara:strand:- start:3176 stop:3493 length:318 start_codon:yes stop_codon:yes gene_type:complete
MSLRVQKRFGVDYSEADMDKSSSMPLSFPTLNNFHQDRYSGFHQRVGGGSIGKDVIPIYKHSHYADPSKYLDNMRGMDDRDKLATMRSIVQKLANTTELSQRAFQ